MFMMVKSVLRIKMRKKLRILNFVKKVHILFCINAWFSITTHWYVTVTHYCIDLLHTTHCLLEIVLCYFLKEIFQSCDVPHFFFLNIHEFSIINFIVI